MSIFCSVTNNGFCVLMDVRVPRGILVRRAQHDAELVLSGILVRRGLDERDSKRVCSRLLLHCGLNECNICDLSGRFLLRCGLWVAGAVHC